MLKLKIVARVKKNKKMKVDAIGGGKAIAFLPWQKDEWSRYGAYDLILPYGFLLLCRLVNVKPKEMMKDFMQLLSGKAEKRMSKLIRKYFLRKGYGKEKYRKRELKQLFKELKEPSFEGELPDKYFRLRREYLHAWFHKWERANAEERDG